MSLSSLIFASPSVFLEHDHNGFGSIHVGIELAQLIFGRWRLLMPMKTRFDRSV